MPLALRIIEAHVPADLSGDAMTVLEELCQESWEQPGGRFGVVACGILGADRTGEALDRLHERIADRGGLLVLVQPLDGVLPRPLASDEQAVRHRDRSAAAVSREEVYASISGTAQLGRTYLALVLLASIVAAVGLSRNNTAAVIGAMVVAPLLGPNMALALGMVLGDAPLVRRALRTGAVGLSLCLTASFALGLLLDADPTTAELASRTQVTIWDLVLALAAGCAGALAYTTGAPTFLTGVMVAVALLPPTVASGLLLAEREEDGALAALLLVAGNACALTLAAMLTFLWQGMRPRNWWQEDRARRSARRGVALFVALLAALAGLVVLAQRWPGFGAAE